MNTAPGYFLSEDSPELQNHPAWRRLENQLHWYGSKSASSKKCYKILRTTQLCLAAAIPVIAMGGVWSKWFTAAFGALIAVLEGLQQLNQFGPQWVEYRATAERLKHEKFLFLSQSGDYRDLEPAEAWRLLAERVEENVSQEHARWTCVSKQTLEKKTAQ